MPRISKACLATLLAMTAIFAACAVSLSGCGSATSPGKSSPSSAAEAVSETSQAPATQTTTAKASYHDGETATLIGTVRMKYSGHPDFSGEALWAYLALDQPITLTGSFAGEKTQSRLQLGSDFSFDSMDDDGKLSIPAWEPYDGIRVTVTGTIKGTAYNHFWLDAYWLEGASIVRS